MHRDVLWRPLWGYSRILWGALLLRTRAVHPPVDSVAFYAYRRRWNLDVARAFGLRFDAHGPLPTAGTLVVSNHAGFADVNALCCLIPAEAKPTMISKAEIGALPIFGWHMRRYGDLLLDRKDKQARKRLVDAALQRLAAGFAVVLFPEGTRSKTGVPKETIRPALIDAAIEAGRPIQPVAISGTASLLEEPFHRLTGHDVVRVDFGKPRTTYTSAVDVWRDVRRLWERGRAELN